MISIVTSVYSNDHSVDNATTDATFIPISLSHVRDTHANCESLSIINKRTCTRAHVFLVIWKENFKNFFDQQQPVQGSAAASDEDYYEEEHLIEIEETLFLQNLDVRMGRGKASRLYAWLLGWLKTCLIFTEVLEEEEILFDMQGEYNGRVQQAQG